MGKRKTDYTPAAYAERLRKERQRRMHLRASDSTYRDRQNARQNARRAEKDRANPEVRARRLTKAAEWRNPRKEEAVVATRAWRAANPDKVKIQRADSKRRELQKSREKKAYFRPEVFAAVLAMQEGRCAICRMEFGTTAATSPRADHCHSTKKARGALCHRCNVTEGLIAKIGLTPTEFAARLEEYLTNPPAQQIQDLV